MRKRFSTWSAVLTMMVVLASALAISTGGTAGAATGNVTITLNVASAGTLGNSCSAASATALGSVLPGGGATTATGAGVCRVTFGSTNDSSMLRLSQADGVGAAMGLGIKPPVVQRRDNSPGRMNATFGGSNLVAYSVGNSAVVERTLNGEASLHSEFSAGGTSLYDVEDTPGDLDNWWLVGASRSLWQTTNARVATPTFTNKGAALGAAGWPAGIAIRGITIPVAGTIVLVGDSRWIAKSTDSGTSWVAFQHTDTNVGNIMGVDALDANNMVAVDDTGRVLASATGGDTAAKWSVSVVATPGSFSDVTMPSATRAYAVGPGGVAWARIGAAWTDRSAAIGLYGDATGVTSWSGAPDTVWVSDEYGGIYRSTDVGATWSFVSAGTGNRVGGIHTPNGTDLYVAAAGRTMAASHDGGATFSPFMVSGHSRNAIGVSPSNGQVAIAVGSSGVSQRTTNGGTTWTTGALPTTRPMFGADMSTDLQGWVVGDQGTIDTTVDGGATWSAQPSGVTTRLLGVVALDRHHLVAVGHGGTIITTQGGGDAWTQRASGTTRTIDAVSGSDTRVIAVGAAATVEWSSDRGTTWNLVAPGSLPDPKAALVGVAVLDDLTAYAATSSNRVWRTLDGGATWTAVAGLTGVVNRSLAAMGQTLVVAGEGDQVATSTDGGGSFSATTGATGLHMVTAAIVDTHTAYVGGQDALLERLDLDPTATAQVPDWSLGANDWAPGNGGFFGVCLQAVAGGAVPDWTVDANATPNKCEQLVGDPWRALPAASSKVAHLVGPGASTVDVVWGFKPGATQAPGRYEATAVFESIAPDA